MKDHFGSLKLKGINETTIKHALKIRIEQEQNKLYEWNIEHAKEHGDKPNET